jgi:hypothetical protein
LHGEYAAHGRQVYGILDVLGDFGGLNSVLLMIGAGLVSSLSEFQFNIDAIQKLYLARTKDDKLFKNKNG